MENAPQAEYQPTDSERNAMRAYLQRMEVRLSTLHRIATAFIGGAGLLLLIPIFFRDVVDGILLRLLEATVNQFPQWGAVPGWGVTLLLLVLVSYPFLLSLAIPLYGVYLLLKDIIQFYFTLYAPGFSSQVLNPTFALHGVNFSPDEAPAAKQGVMRFQYEADHMNFMMPFSEGRRELYFDALMKETENAILPPMRRLEALQAVGVLPAESDTKSVHRFGTAMGIARSDDRTLVQEVAITEMALTRNILYLRRLVLRYVKTLLMFIWTTLVSFLMLPFVQDGRLPLFAVLSVAYLVWSLGVMRIVRLPINWIYRHRRNQEMPKKHVDAQLNLLERHIERYCNAAIGISLAGVVVSLLVYVIL